MDQEGGELGFGMGDQAARAVRQHELPELERHFNVVAFDEQVVVVAADRVAFDAVFLHEAAHLTW